MRWSLVFLSILVSFSIKYSNAQLANCQNYGTPLNSTNCLCPGFTGGALCETRKCQRFGVPDRNRCACPPGWYDVSCQIRGCRPANEDNLNLSKRSLIIVFNMKTSMSKQLEALRNNFNTFIDSITTNSNTGQKDNWISNYIVHGFVLKSNNITTTQMISTDPADVVNFLSKLNDQLQDGDETQPVLNAVINAQQTYPDTKSHGILLVFTDSPASDATPWSHRFTDSNAEQRCLQISLLWRSKVSYILSIPEKFDRTLDNIAVYRRLSMTNHANYFFVKNETETVQLLREVVSLFYYPENIAQGYQVVGNQNVSIVRDVENEHAYILITFDTNQPSIPSISGAQPISHGTSYILYSSTTEKFAQITSDSTSRFDYLIFIQSKNSISIEYHDDDLIDVGNGMIVIGMPMSATMQTFGFPAWVNSTFSITSHSNELIREPYYSYSRNELDCTFPYAFPTWEQTLNCPPGPITQYHNLIDKDGNSKVRVTTGYCIQADHNDDHKNQKIISTMMEENDVETCNERNVEAISDPRLGKHNQLIFILERNSANRKVYETLVSDISKIIKNADASTDGAYKQEFTLIVHCDQMSSVLLSTYNPNTFISKFSTFVNALPLIDNLDNTMGLLSIVQAQKSNIQPTAQVFYFINQAVKNVQNVSRTWDIVKRDIEINFITISDNTNNEVFALPSQLELVKRMSNGRIIPIQSDQQQLSEIFSYSMQLPAISSDDENYNCSTIPFAVDTFIEEDSSLANVQLTGAEIYNLVITDGNGNQLNDGQFDSFLSLNFFSININLTRGNVALGNWKISAQTTRGGCQIVVRQKTENAAILGFSSLKNDDNVSTQIISQRLDTINSPEIYVPIRITQPIGATTIASANLAIQIVNPDRYDLPLNYTTLAITPRDANSCTYNFISNSVSVPRNPLTLWILSAFDSNQQLVFKRTYNYYQHFPSDPSVCHGGNIDSFGRCICPPNFTGDYCWDRICQPAATYSFGICSCPPGYYGDFCEIELLIPVNSSTTIPSTTTTLIPTTTGGSEKVQKNQALFYFAILFLHFMF